MRISDWSSDVCSSDLVAIVLERHFQRHRHGAEAFGQLGRRHRHIRLARRRLLIAEVGLEIGGVGGERRLKGEERLRLPRLQRRDALEDGAEDRGNRLLAMDLHPPVAQSGKGSRMERMWQYA